MLKELVIQGRLQGCTWLFFVPQPSHQMGAREAP